MFTSVIVICGLILFLVGLQIMLILAKAENRGRTLMIQSTVVVAVVAIVFLLIRQGYLGM